MTDYRTFYTTSFYVINAFPKFFDSLIKKVFYVSVTFS